MKLSEYKNKKILIVGFGREGQDTFCFLRKHFPKKSIGIADKLLFQELPKNAKKLLSPLLHGRRNMITRHFGKNYLKALKKYDLIIKSPGIVPHIIAPYITKRQKITSQTEIFFSAFAPCKRSYGGPAVASGEDGENCPGTIIGITGTKGKSTTASLVYAVLKKGGIKAHLVGNIGKPVLELLEKATVKDVFVYELSSFQLALLKQSPQIAVFLNLFPEHLDWHGNFTSYKNAKANITRWQGRDDYLIFNADDMNIQRIAASSKAQKLPFTQHHFSKKGSAGFTKKQGSKNISFVAAKEPVLLVARLFGIPQQTALDVIQKFKPLQHRLELVGTYNGIMFYNDSLATIPEATMSA